jgi:anti-sigma regulatory factor (Ser/Thr protein kinase)
MWTEGAQVLQPLWSGLVPDRLSAASASSCALAPRFEAVGDARRFTGSVLREWGMEGMREAVELVASELVTNALRYALPSEPAEAAEVTVRLSLVRWPARVVCAVRDPSNHGPVAKTPDWVAESGRGLHLVESFSETWGWHPLAPSGKVVWALFRLPDDIGPEATGRTAHTGTGRNSG